MLAILIQGGGTDCLQFTSSKHGLEDGGRIDCTLCGSGTHEGVDLIDEQDDVAASLDFFEHLLEALLEISSITRTSNKCTKIERVQLLSLQRLWHVVRCDGLSESLDDGSLANARLSDEHGVVLGAARQHLHHALCFAISSDHGIELVLTSQLGEVSTELIEYQRPRGCFSRGTCAGTGLLCSTRLGRGPWITREQLNDLLTDSGQVCSELDEDLRSYAFTLTDEAKQDVLGSDVVMAQLKSLSQRKLENFFGARRKGDVTRGGRPTLANDLFYLLPYCLK